MSLSSLSLGPTQSDFQVPSVCLWSPTQVPELSRVGWKKSGVQVADSERQVGWGQTDLGSDQSPPSVWQLCGLVWIT